MRANWRNNSFKATYLLQLLGGSGWPSLDQLKAPPPAPSQEVTTALRHLEAAGLNHRPPPVPPLRSHLWTGGNFLLWLQAVSFTQPTQLFCLYTSLYKIYVLREWKHKVFILKLPFMFSLVCPGLVSRKILFCVIVCLISNQKHVSLSLYPSQTF